MADTQVNGQINEPVMEILRNQVDSVGTPNSEFTLKILTLNCWGLWFGSEKRKERMPAIVRHLNENNYDIVFLQEVWVSSDFESIKEGTRMKYKFAHLYRSGSVLGSSGIVILCRWVPKVVHFEPFSLNGSPFYPWHGDWFAGKGIAYSRVDFDGLSLHLFSTHMHAYYSENESIQDQYSVHRMCQSYQLARFINFITDTASNRKVHGKDLIIVAGDMNSTSSGLPYKILTTMAGLADCYKTRTRNFHANVVHSHKLTSIIEQRSNNRSSALSNTSYYSASSDTEEEDITFCHPRNSFTPMQISYAKKVTKTKASLDQNSNNVVSNKSKKLYSKRTHDTPKKRIDFILCRLLTHGHCLVDRISSRSKDVDTECSLSDHEPVAVELKIIDVSHDMLQQHPSLPRHRDLSTLESLGPNGDLHETINQWLPEKDISSSKAHLCNIHVMEQAQKILIHYHQFNKASKTRLFILALVMFIITLPASSYYALSSEILSLTTLVVMWLGSSFIFSLILLIGFVCYRCEQAAIEAILNDIVCKISVSKEDPVDIDVNYVISNNNNNDSYVGSREVGVTSTHLDCKCW